MKFTDGAWKMYREKFTVPDRDRDRIETEMTAEQEKAMARAGGNEELAIGMLTMSLAKDMAKDFGISENTILKQLIATAPNPQKLKHAIRRARGGH